MNQSNIIIWHNPRCSKSRQTLQLLRDKGCDPQVVEYLKSPPDADAIAQVLQKLGIAAHDLIRKGEPDYKTAGLSADMPEDALIAAMADMPKLIERPVVITQKGAAIGRPPQAVLPLL